MLHKPFIKLLFIVKLQLMFIILCNIPCSSSTNIMTIISLQLMFINLCNYLINGLQRHNYQLTFTIYG